MANYMNTTAESAAAALLLCAGGDAVLETSELAQGDEKASMNFVSALTDVVSGYAAAVEEPEARDEIETLPAGNGEASSTASPARSTPRRWGSDDEDAFSSAADDARRPGGRFRLRDASSSRGGSRRRRGARRGYSEGGRTCGGPDRPAPPRRQIV